MRARAATTSPARAGDAGEVAQGRGREAQRLAEGVRESALPGGRHVSTTLAKFGQDVLLVLDADVVALLPGGCRGPE